MSVSVSTSHLNWVFLTRDFFKKKYSNPISLPVFKNTKSNPIVVKTYQSKYTRTQFIIKTVLEKLLLVLQKYKKYYRRRKRKTLGR